MKLTTPRVAMGGKGTVKMPKWSPKGLRNRRKAHWAAIRLEERRKAEKAASLRDDQTGDRYAEWYGYDN